MSWWVEEDRRFSRFGGTERNCPAEGSYQKDDGGEGWGRRWREKRDGGRGWLISNQSGLISQGGCLGRLMENPDNLCSFAHIHHCFKSSCSYVSVSLAVDVTFGIAVIVLIDALFWELCQNHRPFPWRYAMQGSIR